MTRRKAKKFTNASCLSLPNQRNLKNFLADSKLPHIVCLSVKESNFLVNSVVLCLHSSVFENDISTLTPGDHKIFLHEDLNHMEGIESTVRSCLEYMHGEKIRLTQTNVYNFFKFACIYDIAPLLSSCEAFVESYINGFGIMKLIENVSDIDKLRASATYIRKNCDKIIEGILSEHSISIICDMKSNIEFLKLLVQHCQSKCGGDLLLVLVQSDEFSNSSLLDFPLDKLNYTKLFPIFEEFQKFVGLLVASVQNPASEEHKHMLKRLSLACKILGHSSIKPNVKSAPHLYLEVSPERNNLESSEVPNGNIEFFMEKSSSCCADIMPTIKMSNDTLPMQELFNELDYHVKRNTLGDYYRMELFLGWILGKKCTFDITTLKYFLSTFNFRLLHKTFFEENLRTCFLFFDSFEVDNFINELYDHDTFFLIQRELNLKDLQNSIVRSGNILSPGSSPCLVKRCNGKDHTIGTISIKLRSSSEDQSYGLVRKDQHQKLLHHYYMTLFDKNMKFSGVISLKILSRADVLDIIRSYSYFRINLIYKK